MKLNHVHWISFAALALAPAMAFSQTATPSAIVTPASAPNAFGSPSFAGWVNNAIQAQYLGVSSFGSPGTPTFFQAAPSTMPVLDNVVTGFPSWQGMANPGTVFGPAFTNELGNRLHFALDLSGNGALISIDKLGFTGTSTDPGNTADFSYATGSYTYSNDYRGLLYGVDGIRGTGDDVWITSGPANQLVNEIIGRGSGNAWDIYLSDPGATPQDKINGVNAKFGLGTAPFTFTGTYTYNSATVGSASVTFVPGAAVPDTGATLLLMVLGVAAIVLARRQGRIITARS